MCVCMCVCVVDVIDVGVHGSGDLYMGVIKLFAEGVCGRMPSDRPTKYGSIVDVRNAFKANVLTRYNKRNAKKDLGKIVKKEVSFH